MYPTTAWCIVLHGTMACRLLAVSSFFRLVSAFSNTTRVPTLNWDPSYRCQTYPLLLRINTMVSKQSG